MIEKQHGKNTLVCDYCGDGLGKEFAPSEFRDMIAYAKAEGWKIAPDTLEEGEWVHTCPGCRE